MKVAALDLGSNTFLCLIAEVSASAVLRVYEDSTEVVRLGQELEKTRTFHPEALSRADNCLKKFSEIIKKNKPDKVLAMATSAARDAVNKDELFQIAKKYDIPLEIIPGEKEAIITYQGAVSGYKSENQNIMVIDVGGGSTEFIFGQDQKLIRGESINIGCVRLTEKYIKHQPTPISEINKLTEHITENLLNVNKSKPQNFNIDQIIAVAGTPTSLVAADLGGFDANKIDGFVLTEEKLNWWQEKLTNATVDEKINMGIPKGRADVILVGVIILKKSLELFKKNNLIVSTRGVRYGVALELGRRYLSDN